MTLLRRDVWSLGTAADPWHPTLEFYALAVRAMQAKPLADPTSWSYQAAIHGLAGIAPPPGAPWNTCQHATWYFLPWHRMYLYQFEQIVRQEVAALGGPDDWALPYWNYEEPDRNQLPPAFAQATLPDGSPNPLLVLARRPGINQGLQLPPQVTSSAAAMATTFFTTPSSGTPLGFGGPQTVFAHFGPAPGALENQPHNIMHVVIGGPDGLMSNPDTAAEDPIFWLHHANIDRLWETWRLNGNANPATIAFGSRTFRLRTPSGDTVRTRVDQVLDTVADLDYSYDSLPAVAAVPQGSPVKKRTRTVMVGRSTKAATLGPAGTSVTVPVPDLPPASAAAAEGPAPHIHIELADIEGTVNPGVVYGVYVNLPARPKAQQREAHRVGLVSFFGLEQTAKHGKAAGEPLRYVFDATDVVERIRSRGDVSELTVTLEPIEGMGDERAAAAEAPTVSIGTIAVLTS